MKKNRSDDTSTYSMDNSSKNTTMVDFTVSSDRNRNDDIEDEQCDSTSNTGKIIIIIKHTLPVVYREIYINL